MQTGIQRQKTNHSSQFEQDGFQIFNSLIKPDECDLLAAELTPLFEQRQKSAKSKTGGIRNLLHTNSSVTRFSKSCTLLSIFETFGGLPFFPVRAIFFDKNPKANWLVPWHQDLGIAVAERIETPGFTGWSIKDGVLHVHPPQEILESMVTMRLHLEDCLEENGALKIISGSHLHGKLNSAQVAEWTSNQKIITCEVPKGGVLLMRPLLLHSSSPAKNPSHRRVLHIEYATQELPNGLKWFDC